jgi:TPR repeat protein
MVINLKTFLRRTFEYAKKGCDAGDSKSCQMAAVCCIPNLIVFSPFYVKTDYLAGLDFLKRGCDLGDSDSCYMAGGLYLNGVAPVIEPDRSAAFHYDFKVMNCFYISILYTYFFKLLSE